MEGESQNPHDIDPLAVEYDFLICGTNLPMCILAAAAARAGKTVLHIDANEFYGGDSASVSIPQLQELASRRAWEKRNELYSRSSTEESSPVALPPSAAGGRLSGEIRCHRGNPLWFHPPLFEGFHPGVEKTGRRYNLDLFPSLILSRGVMTDTLIESGVASYTEFKCINAVYVALPSSSSPSPSFFRLPTSKSDVFSGDLGLLEKRSLMKFLQFSSDLMYRDGGSHTPETDRLERLNERLLGAGRSLLRPQNKGSLGPDSTFGYDEWRGKPFIDFLRDAVGLSTSLVTIVAHGIAAIPSDTPSPGSEGVVDGRGSVTTEEGMRRVVQYMESIGRYGPGAYLITMYGAGDIAQAFTRVSAVNGGIYVLDVHPTAAVVVGEEGKDKVAGLLLRDGRYLRGKTIVSTPEYLPPSWDGGDAVVGGSRGGEPPASVTVVAVLVLDKPFLPSNTHNGITSSLAYAVLPSSIVTGDDGLGEGDIPSLHVLQTGTEAGTAPSPSVSPFATVLHVWLTIPCKDSDDSDGSAARSRGTSILRHVVTRVCGINAWNAENSKEGGDGIKCGYSAMYSTSIPSPHHHVSDPVTHPINWQVVSDTAPAVTAEAVAVPAYPLFHARERHPINNEGDAEAAWSVYEEVASKWGEGGRGAVERWFKKRPTEEKGPEEEGEGGDAPSTVEGGAGEGPASIPSISSSTIPNDNIITSTAEAAPITTTASTEQVVLPLPTVDLDDALAALMGPDGTLDF